MRRLEGESSALRAHCLPRPGRAAWRPPCTPAMLSACVSSLAGDGGSATVDGDGRSVGYQPHVTFQQMQGQWRFERDRVQALVASVYDA